MVFDRLKKRVFLLEALGFITTSSVRTGLGFKGTKVMGATNLVRLCRSLGPAVVRTQSRARSYRSIRCFSIPADGSVTYLRNGQNGAEVYLVGTCHVSNKSAEHVKEVIDCTDPNVIAVELCKKRAETLQNLKSGKGSMLQLILDSWQVKGGLLKKLLRLYLGLQYHHLRVIGLEPGKEFKVALEECKRRKAQLVLIDEDVDVIVGKLVDVLSFNVIIRLLKAGRRLEEMVGNVFLKDAIEKFSERDFARQIMEIMAVECPEIMRVLINHRDQVMFKHLRSCEGKVVGVVGMGHMDGIERLWKHVEQNMLKDKNETLECSPNAK